MAHGNGRWSAFVLRPDWTQDEPYSIEGTRETYPGNFTIDKLCHVAWTRNLTGKTWSNDGVQRDSCTLHSFVMVHVRAYCERNGHGMARHYTCPDSVTPEFGDGSLVIHELGFELAYAVNEAGVKLTVTGPGFEDPFSPC